MTGKQGDEMALGNKITSEDYDSLQDGPVDSLVMPSPHGVVALFIGKDGRVIANTSDFDLSGYGGFSLRQSQEIRVKSALAREVLDKLSSSLICEAIDTRDALRIMASMCSRCGCRVEIVAIGHEA